jgi:hypothetical protein
MAVNWKKNKNLRPESVLDNISLHAQVVDGKVSFSGGAVRDDLLALKSMLSFPHDIGDIDQDRLLWRSVSDAILTGSLDRGSLITGLSTLLKIESSVKEVPYQLLTGVSLVRNFRARAFGIGHDGIIFMDKKWPRKYQGRTSAITDSNVTAGASSSDYENIIVTVKAKSPLRAATKALRCLDLQRGIWCFLCNHEMQFTSNEWKPINRVRLSQFHTLHLEDGAVAAESVWHEPNFYVAEPYAAANPSLFLKNCRWIRRKIEASKYSKILEGALIRYVRALDEPDQNVALIKLWSALENLAAPNEQNADALVRRCSFLYDKPDYQAQMLEHLREYRNKSVHAGDQSERAMRHCYQLQTFFRDLFRFHLHRADEFESIEVANAFLDMPTDPNRLRGMKAAVDKAMQFRETGTRSGRRSGW